MKNLTRHQRNCNGVPPPAVKPTWRKDSIDGRYYCTFEGCNSKKNWTCSSGVWKVSFLIVISYVLGKVFCSKSYTIISKLFPFYCYSIIMQSMRTWAMQRMAYINATCVIKGSQQRQCSISIGKKISNKLTKIEIHLENYPRHNIIIFYFRD